MKKVFFFSTWISHRTFRKCTSKSRFPTFGRQSEVFEMY